jgi:hypothetical protein
MVAVKERMNRIQKLRRLLGMKYDRSIEVEINSLAIANLSSLRAFASSEAFEVVKDVLERTAKNDDAFVIQNALSGDSGLLAYHKAVADVSRKILEIFDTSKITEAVDEMTARNEVLTRKEEVPSLNKTGHFLSVLGRLENARE